jgi:hypothetical protein
VAEGGNMYIASLDGLSYEIHSVGKTQEECKQNMVKGFLKYVESFGHTVEEWVEGCRESLSDYNNDVWTFLHEYYGVHLYDITKGYALGWE